MRLVVRKRSAVAVITFVAHGGSSLLPVSQNQSSDFGIQRIGFQKSVKVGYDRSLRTELTMKQEYSRRRNEEGVTMQCRSREEAPLDAHVPTEGKDKRANAKNSIRR